MLNCKVDLNDLSDSTLECGKCHKCLGQSKLDYPFKRDLFNSDDLVKEIMKYIEENTNYVCRRTEIDKNPDINVYKNMDYNDLVCRVEAKYLEGQAFMSSKVNLGLYPKETLVVDLPKLLSYFDCKKNDRNQGNDIPIYVVWKFDRLCDDVGGIAVFQEISKLEDIYNELGNARVFQRRIGNNDIQGGVKLGVIDKYHFSIRECEPIENLIQIINAL